MKKFWIAFFLPTMCFSQNTPADKLKEKINSSADKVEAKTILWRKDIHQNPELGNFEKRTAKIVADHLRSLGIEVKEDVGKNRCGWNFKRSKTG